MSREQGAVGYCWKKATLWNGMDREALLRHDAKVSPAGAQHDGLA